MEQLPEELRIILRGLVMCPYLDKGCTIQGQYKDTDLCQERYSGCPGYAYAGVKGFTGMPKNALDWSVFLRKGD